jgi:hypothetical protein
MDKNKATEFMIESVIEASRFALGDGLTREDVVDVLGSCAYAITNNDKSEDTSPLYRFGLVMETRMMLGLPPQPE